jgi:hypothetical protein
LANWQSILVKHQLSGFNVLPYLSAILFVKPINKDSVEISIYFATMLKHIQQGSKRIQQDNMEIEPLLTKKIFPKLLSTWWNSGEGVLQISSQVSSQAFRQQSCSDSTSEDRKLIEITIKGWEHQKFYILPGDAKRYPYPKPQQTDSTHNRDNVTTVINCITVLLLDTWRTTQHGSIVITSEKHRNGNIEVSMGTTPSHRFILDPTQLRTFVTEEIK